MPHNQHFLRTCKRFFLEFIIGCHAAEMPNRYSASVYTGFGYAKVL